MNPLVPAGYSQPTSPVVVALDFQDADRALRFVSRLDPRECRLKVGKELFTGCGPSLLSALSTMGFRVFLDLKFHDIPNTVAQACKAAADAGVWMVNVHASGGRRMMDAARDALAPYTERPLLIAVTVLTSMMDADLAEIGIATTPKDHVLLLAKLASACGLDGVVCSAHEAHELKTSLCRDLKLVTPGIRLVSSPDDDQRRVMSPLDALSAGSDYLVIGRPITRAPDPLSVLRAINQDIQRYQAQLR